MFVCCECCVLSGRGLCDGLITSPEESYRLWRVVVCDQETSNSRRLKPATGLWKIQPQWVVTRGKQRNIVKTWVKWWRSWFRYCPTIRKVAGSIPDYVIVYFTDIRVILLTTLCAGIDSASNRKEYLEYFLVLKAAGAYGRQPYHLYVPTVLKSGSLNLLEPSVPVQACTVIVYLYLYYEDIWCRGG